jgi:hypothetical protein
MNFHKFAGRTGDETAALFIPPYLSYTQDASRIVH